MPPEYGRAERPPLRHQGASPLPKTRKYLRTNGLATDGLRLLRADEDEVEAVVVGEPPARILTECRGKAVDHADHDHVDALFGEVRLPVPAARDHVEVFADAFVA